MAGSPGKRSQPAHRQNADLLFAAADTDAFLGELADTLREKTSPRRGQWLNTNDLEQLYGHCEVPTHQWSRLTNLLEKLAIVTAASA